jgi:hypothetical protein
VNYTLDQIVLKNDHHKRIEWLPRVWLGVPQACQSCHRLSRDPRSKSMPSFSAAAATGVGKFDEHRDLLSEDAAISKSFSAFPKNSWHHLGGVKAFLGFKTEDAWKAHPLFKAAAEVFECIKLSYNSERCGVQGSGQIQGTESLAEPQKIPDCVFLRDPLPLFEVPKDISIEDHFRRVFHSEKHSYAGLLDAKDSFRLCGIYKYPGLRSEAEIVSSVSLQAQCQKLQWGSELLKSKVTLKTADGEIENFALHHVFEGSPSCEEKKLKSLVLVGKQSWHHD